MEVIRKYFGATIIRASKLGHTLTQKRKALLKFSIIQVAVMAALIGGGVTAITIADGQTKSNPTISTVSDAAPSDESSEQSATQSEVATQPAANNSATKQAKQADNTNIQASTKQYEDSNAKFEAEQAKYNQCNNANAVAGQQYVAAIDRAKAAYDEVMGWWEAAKNQPVHNPYSEYAAQAKANHNAISVPAYSEYVSTVSALKSQGCQITQTYPDYSWN